MQWPTGGSYFDLSSVFQVNGLAPQQFKPAPYRSNTRSRKQSRGSSAAPSTPSDPQAYSSSGNGVLPGKSTMAPSISLNNNVRNNGVNKTLPLGGGDPSKANHVYEHDGSGGAAIGVPLLNSDGVVEMIRFLPATVHLTKQVVAPRHHRKKRDDEPATGAQPPLKDVVSRGHFDLEDSAFPPLPGLEAAAQGAKPAQHQANPEAAPLNQGGGDSQPLGQWGESRLADVVKGIAKTKTSSKESSTGGDNDSSGTLSPQFAHYNQHGKGTVQQESKEPVVEVEDVVVVTPPSTPEK